MTIRSSVAHEVKELWSNGKGRPLTAISIGWGLLVGVRMVYPIIIPYLQTTYDLRLAIAGLLVTVLWLSYSVGQLPGGLLADRYDELPLMSTSLFTVSIALGFIIAAPSVLNLFVATAVIGFASSLYPIARMTYLSRLYEERFGSALGVTMAVADLGQTVLPPIAAFLVVTIAWQAGLGFVAPFLVVIGVILLVSFPGLNDPNASNSTTSLRDMLETFTDMRKSELRKGAVILFLYMFIWQSFTAFFPTYLVTNRGVSSTVTSILFGLFFAIGIPVKLLAGAAYDSIGVRKSLIGILIPPTIGFALLPLADNLGYLVGSTVLISIMLGSGTVTQSYLADALPAETQGAGLGVVRSSVSIIASSGPLIFGLIADYNYFNEGYFLMAVILAIALVVTIRMRQPYSR